MELKDSNPKGIAATDRVPMSLFPDTALVYGNLAFLEGALKYGRYNWRAVGVCASTYMDSVRRHMTKWWGGEWVDPVTGVPHLASALAGIAILIDAVENHRLTDDRPPLPVGDDAVSEIFESFRPLVRKLQRDFAHHNPKQYTIQDELPSNTADYVDPFDRAFEDGDCDREHRAVTG
jgi:hypothetical protein